MVLGAKKKIHIVFRSNIVWYALSSKKYESDILMKKGTRKYSWPRDLVFSLYSLESTLKSLVPSTCASFFDEAINITVTAIRYM